MALIAVAGSANTDMVAFVPRLPSRGETVLAGSYVQAGGGKGANQAIAARRMGADVVFIGAVGRDANGEATRRTLASEGIDVSCLFDKDVHSGTALILVEEGSGENVIAVAPGANHALSPDDIRSAAVAIASCDLLLVQMEIKPETIAAAVEAASDAGRPVMLNPAPAPAPELLHVLLPKITWLTPNQHELARITGGKSPHAAAGELFSYGLKGLFVTLGSEGAALYLPDKPPEKVPAFKVAPVDTVGAGDAFNGALAVMIAEGRPLEEALAAAAAAGALAVTKKGAQPSQPYRSDVERLVAGR